MPAALTNAQIRFLRGQAHDLKAMLQVGGKGITEALVAEVELALEHHELIKVKVLSKTSPIESKEALQELAKSVKAEVIQTIGHNGLLYRKNDQKNGIEFPS